MYTCLHIRAKERLSRHRTSGDRAQVIPARQVRPLIVTAYCLESVSRLQCREGKLRQSLADPSGEEMELGVWRDTDSWNSGNKDQRGESRTGRTRRFGLSPESLRWERYEEGTRAGERSIGKEQKTGVAPVCTGQAGEPHDPWVLGQSSQKVLPRSQTEPCLTATWQLSKQALEGSDCVQVTASKQSSQPCVGAHKYSTQQGNIQSVQRACEEAGKYDL